MQWQWIRKPLLLCHHSCRHRPHLQVCSYSSFFFISYFNRTALFASNIPSSAFFHGFSDTSCTQKPFSTNSHISPSPALPPSKKPTSTSSPVDETGTTNVDSTSNRCFSIARSVISRCCHTWQKKSDTDASSQVSLQHILNQLLQLSPAPLRHFWLASSLKPEDVLEILMEVQSHHRKLEKANILWVLFNWAANQGSKFEHLPQSCKIMVSVLIQAGLLDEAERLIRTMELRRLLLRCPEVYSEIIEKYVKAQDVKSSIRLYRQARDQRLTLSRSCCQMLLDLSIRVNQTQFASGLFSDMTEAGYISDMEIPAFEFVIGSLCRDQKIQETRNMLKRLAGFGIKPTVHILNKIADGYCEKMDFEDLVNFLNEWKHVPDAHCCNKIISLHCRNWGTEFAWLFLKKLEVLGFMPDEVTFGILISWSCKERKLKNAIVYMSELQRRSLKPSFHVYNALMSAMFKEGLGEHAKNVFYDMVEKGMVPDLSTFRVLLAGYCNDRKFDQVKLVMREMVKFKHVSLSPLDSVLSKAFKVMGLDSLQVKVKRDNDAGHPRAEFFDSLGNGLYLESYADEFERTITRILDDALSPNFDLIVADACTNGDIETAMSAKNKMGWWGQKLSLSVYTELLKRICVSNAHVDSVIILLEETMEQLNQLDQATLNLLIQAVSKKEIYKAKLIADVMLQRQLPLDNGTYTALIMGFCKEGGMKEFQQCWELAQKNDWLPRPKECQPLIRWLCQRGMLSKTMELFGSMDDNCPLSDICNIFLKELCATGFTSAGHILLEQVLLVGLVLDDAIYYHLLKGFCQEKKWYKAFTVLDILLEKRMPPRVNEYGLLIFQLCKSNRVEKARTLKEIMLREQPATSVYAYNALLNGLCKMREVNEAALELQKMIAEALCIDNDTINIMLSGYSRENNVSAARELLAVMLRRNLSISVSGYRDFVCIMCKQGRVHDALSLKDVLLREDGYPNLVVYNLLIFYLFQTGNSLFVAEILDEMLGRGLILDKFTYNFLVCGYFKCQDVIKSVDTLMDMIGKGLKPSNRCVRIVIDYLCNHDGLEKALQVSRMMEVRGWMHGSVVQTLLVVGLLSRGRLQEAELFLSRMRTKGLIPDSIDYNVLIRWFCDFSRVNEAVDLLNVMLMKGNLPSDMSYNAVVQGFCICKANDHALEFHTEMLQKKLVPSIGSWKALVQGLCADGRVGEAERILEMMLQSGQTPTRDIYLSLIEKYNSDNNLSKASELLHRMQQNGLVPDFQTHWSIINNLRSADDKENSNRRGFLSSLLSQSGFPMENIKPKGHKTAY